LPQGSSGSLVIKAASGEVYGHIVADDTFGDVFVVPLSDVLDDVKLALKAETVTLPTFADLCLRLPEDQVNDLAPSDGQITPLSSRYGWQQTHRYPSPLPTTPLFPPPEIFFRRTGAAPEARPMASNDYTSHESVSPPTSTQQRSGKIASGLSEPPRAASSIGNRAFRASNYISNYIRQTSPDIIKPFGGHLSPRFASSVLKPEAHLQSSSPAAARLSQFPYGSYLPPAPVFSNVNNPNRQLALEPEMPPGMVPRFASAHAASIPHYVAQSTPPQLPANDRPFRCDQCPQSFNRNYDLNRHKRIHLAVKPFACGHCDKSFSRKDALKVCFDLS